MDTVVDLRNQDSRIEGMVKYLSACNQALQADNMKLELENKVLKAKLRETLVIHEQRVVVEDRKVLWGRL